MAALHRSMAAPAHVEGEDNVMIKSNRRTARYFRTAAAAALAAGAVLTEDMEAAAQSAIDEITVTARKREENLQDVPVSVTALTFDTLQSQGITNVREVAELIPGLTFQESFGRRDDRPGLRGLTSIGDPSFGVESGVSIFIDGVYIAGDSSTFGLRDIERVEVVRGPQSALYGRNSYAGAINFVTRAPGDEVSGTVTGRAARYGEYEASAYVAAPIVPGLSGSLFGRYYTYDGEYTNSFDNSDDVGDEETISIAGALFAEPNERVSLRARVAYQEDDDGHIPFTMQVADTDFAGDGINPNGGDDYFVGALPGAENNIVGPLNEDLLFTSGMERETIIVTARGDFDLGRGFSATLLGGYYNEDRQTGSDSAPAGTIDSGLSLLPFDDQQLESFSLEARIDSPQDQRIRGSAGFFFFDEERNNITVNYENIASFTPVGPRPDSVAEGLALGQTDPTNPSALESGENDRGTTNWAVFGLVAIDLLEQLTLTGEFRYAEDEKRITGFDSDEPGVEQFPDKITFDSFNPRVILEYKATDDVLLYASVAKGNKPGGFNNNANRDPQPILTLFGGDREPTFGEETAWTYEGGAKTTWADGRLRINVSGYYSDVENAQLTQTYSWCVGLPSPFCFFVPGGEFRAGANIINIPEVRVIGGELEVGASLNDYIDLNIGYAFTDSEIQRGESRDHGRLFFPFDGENTLGESELAGLKFPRISRHQVNVVASGEYPTDYGSLFMNLSGSYESERFVQVSNLAVIPEAFILNARAGVNLNSGVQLALFGRNILDEDAPVDALRFRDGDFVRAFQIANRKGATIGGEVIFNF